MLVKSSLSNDMKAFMLKVNKMKQDDANVAIEKYCETLENSIFKAIKSITITIPTGSIVANGANTGGPVVAINIQPIVLNNVIT